EVRILAAERKAEAVFALRRPVTRPGITPDARKRRDHVRAERHRRLRGPNRRGDESKAKNDNGAKHQNLSIDPSPTPPLRGEGLQTCRQSFSPFPLREGGRGVRFFRSTSSWAARASSTRSPPVRPATPPQNRQRRPSPSTASSACAAEHPAPTSPQTP